MARAAKVVLPGPIKIALSIIGPYRKAREAATKSIVVKNPKAATKQRRILRNRIEVAVRKEERTTRLLAAAPT